MKRKKKITIGIGLLLVGILFWQFGLFNRFNYLTAKIDGWRNSARIVTTEPPLHPCGVPCIGLKEDYGFHEHYTSCNQTGPTIRGIKAYNAEIEKYLNKRNGKDWRAKYQAELDSLIKNNRLE
ncbi:hypothetical protein DUT90_00025 [Polaribacter sp. WD7]|uniref:Uncharacterized protein n=1 Tax=Algibacter pectinivorans TaxID=870482 RepID=A0A1I1P5U4_9FLAO|nr:MULTISPECIES: hypothetical protein [Flavobacteriaceae]RCS28533.1 hypothetical protein DUT90_00025 [Polaribacter sp. WD7]SFD02363.1 hypothetical protein SAMN04487987_1033 [Algibacter pectinivorans]